MSVLIPTYRRAAKLAACVASLARQVGDATFEVVVGLDGPDAESERAAREVWKVVDGAAGRELRLVACERAGYTMVRSRLVREARGRVMLSLNDDVVADEGLVAAHWAEHERRRHDGKGPAIVVGDAPYARKPAGEMDSMLDRLVRETPMVFFYDVMNTPPPEGRTDREKDWGFRHCFGLNFSADLGCVREVGGFRALEHVYGYDDIELGFKLAKRFGMPVLYRPEARVAHHHWYIARDLLAREFMLGRAAWAFAGANPEFGAAVFGRDIRSGSEIAYSREFVHREAGAAERGLRTLEALERVPSDAIGSEYAGALLRALYEQHLIAKRRMWRRGLLEAAETESDLKA